MSLDLSLYQLESQLLELIDMRESAPNADEAAVIDEQIAVYITAEIRKVDSIRGYWRHCEMMAEAADQEAMLQKNRSHEWMARLDQLKGAVKRVMESMPWPEGKTRKLEGRTGSLTLRGNGGAQPVILTDEALVPDEYRTVTVTMSLADWSVIKTEYAWLNDPTRGKSLVSLSLVAKELQKPCPECEAKGHTCSVCGGTGRRGVPGAHLGERGSSVTCK